MKDRPGGDTGTFSSPSVASLRSMPLRLAMAHFWKIFACAGLIGGLCVCYAAVSARRGDHEFSDMPSTSQDEGSLSEKRRHFLIMRDLIDKQSQPASIVFKNQTPAVVGYLASADDECVVLRSLYKEEAKEQTILIPWENILYIRLNTKIPPTDQEVVASRGLRLKSGVPTRR